MSDYSVSVQGLKLTDLLTKTGKFVIPNYQRPYSWRQKEWKDLFDDLMDHFESQNHLGSDYPMGEVRLERSEGGAGPYQVADGQQRLVTFSILTAAIMRVLVHELGMANSDDKDLLFEKEAGPGGDTYVPRIEDQVAGNSIVLTSLFGCPDPESAGIGPFVDAYRWFVERIRADFGDDSQRLLKFRFHIQTRLIFTRTISGPGTGQQAFARANNRGKKLDDADLVKFALLEKANHGQDAKKVWSDWQEFSQVVRELPGKKESKLLVLWAATDLSEDANPVRKSDARSLVADRAALAKSGGAGVASVTEKLVSFAKSYQHLLSGKGTDGNSNASMSNIVNSPSLRKHSQLATLALACRHMDEVSRDAASLAIENTIVVVAFTRAFPPDVERLVNRVRSYWRPPTIGGSDDFEKGLMELRDFRNSLASRFARMVHFESQGSLPRKGAHTILGYAEAHIRATVNGVRRGTLELGATLEHVLPQTLTAELIEEYGSGDQATIDRYRLGNLTLLEGPPNTVASNRKFSLKLPTYETSPFRITQLIAKRLEHEGNALKDFSDILLAQSNWTRASVETRAKGLHELLCATLDLDVKEPLPLSDDQVDSFGADTSIGTVPQADDADEILRVLEMLSAGNETSAEIAVALERDTRHANYYLKALETLGLAESDEDTWQLTEEGAEVASVDTREIALSEVMVANPLLVSWRSFSTVAEKEAYLAGLGISGSTITRRRQTLDKWWAWANARCPALPDEA